MSSVISLDAFPRASFPKGYRLVTKGSAPGVYAGDKTNSEKIAGPVRVTAYTEDELTGIQGMVIAWEDAHGKQHEEAFPLDVLHKDAKMLAQSLALRGLIVVPGKEQKLLHYLGSFDRTRADWIKSTPKVGWLDANEEKLVYVMPDDAGGVIAPDKAARVVFQPEQHSPSTATMHPKDTLADWQKYVAEPCRGNPFLVFSICLALAGPLVKAARSESGGIHFYGRSSRGKTTAAQVAASVFGCGADPSDNGFSYVQKWNATVNAFEALLAAHNDGLLVLDEIHTCDAKDFGSVIYNLAGGRGKSRLDKNAGLRQQRTWRALVLSTGEKSARQKIEEENKRIFDGQRLRLLDVPTDHGIITDAHGNEPGDFALSLKRACARYYGTAGTAFVRTLIEKYDNHSALAAVVQRELEDFERALAPPNLGPVEQRGLRRLALVQVAGKLASELGVLPFDSDEIARAVQVVTRAWLSDDVTLPEAVRGAQQVQGFIQRHQARFRPADNDHETPRDLAGYVDPRDGLYLFTPEGFTEAVAGYDVKDVARELRTRQLLFSNEKDRFVSKHQIRIGGEDKRLRLYAVKADILEHDFSSANAEVLKS